MIGRVTSKRYGSAKTRSSRFAEAYHSTTFWPAAIGWPASSVSSVAVRRKWITGVAQRTISSTAVRVCASKSPYQQLALVGVLGERLHAVADRVARRLVAGHDEQDEERPELLASSGGRRRPRPSSAPT